MEKKSYPKALSNFLSYSSKRKYTSNQNIYCICQNIYAYYTLIYEEVSEGSECNCAEERARKKTQHLLYKCCLIGINHNLNKKYN